MTIFAHYFPEMNLKNNTPLARPLHLITRDYVDAFTHKLTHLDIDRHFYILILIENEGNCITQQELAQTLQVDKVTIGRIIDYLVKNKYVIRAKHPSDKRAHHLKLTEKAVKVLPEIKKVVCELNKISVQGLSKEETDCFFKVARQIQLNLAKLPADTIQYKFNKIRRK